MHDTLPPGPYPARRRPSSGGRPAVTSPETAIRYGAAALVAVFGVWLVVGATGRLRG